MGAGGGTHVDMVECKSGGCIIANHGVPRRVRTCLFKVRVMYEDTWRLRDRN